jgi:hypothetical protein
MCGTVSRKSAWSFFTTYTAIVYTLGTVASLAVRLS